MSDPRGVSITMSYDLLGRKTQEVYNDANANGVGLNGVITNQWFYDTCGLRRLCGFSDYTGTTTFNYGSNHLISSKQWSLSSNHDAYNFAGGNISLLTSFTYDSRGNLISMTLPSGKVVSYILDDFGRKNSVSVDGQSFISNIQWTPFNSVKSWQWNQLPNTIQNVSYTYDLNGMPIQINTDKNKTLVWDFGNRLLAVDDNQEPLESQLFTYDKLNRLTSMETGLWNSAQTMTYDSVGNRLTKRTTASQDGWNLGYSSTSNRLTGKTPVVGGVSGVVQPLTLDSMGNTLSDGNGKNFLYDAASTHAFKEQSVFLI